MCDEQLALALAQSAPFVAFGRNTTRDPELYDHQLTALAADVIVHASRGASSSGAV